ncbi:copper transporter [Actinopolyspora xinjiangensis]|uniref:copper transporter n=1 Tax=Actinopolyspora xinjiangensis TaxID=405564 RepID=UPI00147E1B9E|nr:copper transporter [Actinopolyspora xinjiangensis]
MRYHVVSIAAVFLALALGVLLGSNSVSRSLLTTVGGQREELRQQLRQLRSERDTLRDELAGATALTDSIAPRAVRGELRGTKVALLVAPGGDSARPRAVRRMIEVAGGSVTGTLRLTDKLTGPNTAAGVRELAPRLLPAGARLPVTSDPGTLAGGMLSPLILLDGGDGEPRATERERTVAFEELRDNGFVRVSPGFGPAELAVVLTGDGERRDPLGIVPRLAARLDRGSSGVVLAGATGSARGNGTIGIARSDDSVVSSVSTVDNAETTGGRVATVLALRGELRERVGSYGIGAGAERRLPEPFCEHLRGVAARSGDCSER